MTAAAIDPFYADAEACDVAYGWDSSAETARLVEYAARLRGGPIARALEVGCGPGRVLRDLAALGLQAVGIDRDAGLLAYARKRAADLGLSIESALADMRDFKLAAPVDAAFCPLNGVGDLTAPGDLARHLAAVGANLAPRGVYVIEISFAPIERDFVGRPAPWAMTRDGLRVEADWRLVEVDGDAGLATYEAQLTIQRPDEAPKSIVSRRVHRKWDQPLFYAQVAASPLALAGLFAGDLTPLDPAQRLTYADDNVFVFLQKRA